MPYSTQEAVSDGTLVLLSISIEYLDRTEIAVYYDGVVNTTNWSWVGTTGNQIQFDPAVPTGVVITVKRVTALGGVLHDFTGGAAFTTLSLDENFQQILHIAQEATEGSLGGDFFTDVDFHGHGLKHIQASVEFDDAVRRDELLANNIIVEAYVVQAEDARDAALLSAIAAASSASSISPENLLAKAANLSDVANAETARTNLGAAPTASPVFTGAVTVPTNYNVSGSSGSLQVGGVDAVNWDITGLLAGSYAPGSIVAADLTLVANSAPIKTALNAAGSAPIFACRAWANLNGTGTAALRAAGNISSVVDNGTGNYQFNFAVAMPDEHYAISIGASYISQAGTQAVGIRDGSPPTVNSFTLIYQYAGAAADPLYLTVSIFR